MLHGNEESSSGTLTSSACVWEGTGAPWGQHLSVAAADQAGMLRALASSWMGLVPRNSPSVALSTPTHVSAQLPGVQMAQGQLGHSCGFD